MKQVFSVMAVLMFVLNVSVVANAARVDVPTSGYCAGYLRYSNDTAHCEAPGGKGYRSPGSQVSASGTPYARHLRCCHDPNKPIPAGCHPAN